MHAEPAPGASTAAARAVMRGNRRRDTGPELRLRSALHARGFRFRIDHPIEAGERRVRPDIVFTRQRVAVFVDGCFWHACPQHGTQPRTHAPYWAQKLARNVARDRRVDADLESSGWRVVRVWEHEAPEAAAGTVAAVLH